MLRHLHILAVFYKAAILTDLEYRANALISAVLSIVSVAWTIAGVAIFFLHTDQIGDWSFDELLLVLGIYVLFLGLVDMIMYPNVREIVQLIRQGTMDFILTKPLNSQFHTSLRRINIWKLTDVLLGIGLTFYALTRLPTSPTAIQVGVFLLLCICSIIILYSLVMLLITSSFWFVQLENVMELLFTFYDAGRFPVSIYPSWVRMILTFVVPIAFVTTIPAEVLLGRVSLATGLVSILISAGMLILSILFWRYAVRHYSSASS